MRTCSVEGCERKHWGKTLCQSHYSLWYQSQPSKPFRPVYTEVTGAVSEIRRAKAIQAWQRRQGNLSIGELRVTGECLVCNGLNPPEGQWFCSQRHAAEWLGLLGRERKGNPVKSWSSDMVIIAKDIFRMRKETDYVSDIQPIVEQSIVRSLKTMNKYQDLEAPSAVDDKKFEAAKATGYLAMHWMKVANDSGRAVASVNLQHLTTVLDSVVRELAQVKSANDALALQNAALERRVRALAEAPAQAMAAALNDREDWKKRN